VPKHPSVFVIVSNDGSRCRPRRLFRVSTHGRDFANNAIAWDLRVGATISPNWTSSRLARARSDRIEAITDAASEQLGARVSKSALQASGCPLPTSRDGPRQGKRGRARRKGREESRVFALPRWPLLRPSL